MPLLCCLSPSDMNLDNCHWSSKVDRPTKRIHTASIDVGNDNKRIKCDESTKPRSCHLGLEDHLLAKQQRQQQQPSSRKCSPSSLGNSQLLRRLVSHQNALRNSNFGNESLEGAANGRQSRLDSELDASQDGEGDGGGGDSGDGGGRKAEGKESGRCGRDGVESGVDAIGQIPQRNPACNSVLMNLLVSGCDVSAGYVCFAKPKPSKSIAST